MHVSIQIKLLVAWRSSRLPPPEDTTLLEFSSPGFANKTSSNCACNKVYTKELNSVLNYFASSSDNKTNEGQYSEFWNRNEDGSNSDEEISDSDGSTSFSRDLALIYIQYFYSRVDSSTCRWS